MPSRRQLLIVLATCSCASLTGCGFELRRAPNFAFQSIYLSAGEGSALVNELRRQLQASGKVQVIRDTSKAVEADVQFDLLQEQHEKVVLSVDTSGNVLEFQLRLRSRFRLRGKNGKTLIDSAEIVLQRDISFNSSAVLSKESEENLLYRDMQNDAVQQIMRRLAAVKAL